MKMYERIEAGRIFIPTLPIIARIDGRSFHSFTKGMDRPFDAALNTMMVETTMHLVRETNACMGYTQSDEITLAWHSTDTKSQVWFDGKIHKMVSQLAAQATLKFYMLCDEISPYYAQRKPTFDARVWQVPNRTEGANVFLWREWDATKNSISMVAQSMFSHKELHGKDSNAKQAMMLERGRNWNDYPAKFKRGSYVQRQKRMLPFSADELDALPPKHAARTNPDLQVMRSFYEVLNMPPLGTVTNRETVIFEGDGPIVILPSR